MDTPLAPLEVERIREATRDLDLDPDIHYLPVIDSTNRFLRDLAPGHWRNGTTLFADFQEAGRGRQGRSWQAPPRSSILMSIGLALPDEVLATDGIMMMTLAVAGAIEEVTGTAPELKWPNDLLMRGRKVCGILAEFDEQAGMRRLILGVGINVATQPLDVSLPDATSLEAEAGKAVSREALGSEILRQIDHWFGLLRSDPDAVFAAWRGYLGTLGRPVRVIEPEGAWDGLAVGVLRSGALQVRTADGEIRPVFAADVSIRTGAR